MKKVVIVGENTDKPSGFGQQTDFLATALSDDYHVTVLSQDGVTKKKKSYRSITTGWTDYPQMDRLFESIKPDIFIMFGPLQAHGGFFLSELCKHVSPYLWLAWESVSPDLGLVAPLSQLPQQRIVHLSNFSRKIWAPYCTDNHPVIPHSVDTKEFCTLDEKHEDLCKELSEKYVQYIDPKAFKILFLDRNDSRKRHDLAIDVVRRLLAMGVNAQIIFHTKKKDASYDVAKLCELMGVPRERYVLTDFDWCKGLTKEDLNKLYNVCQARLSCSGGEGFGIPSIESMAAGCVNVVPNNTCFPEVVEDAGLLINCANLNGSFYQSAIYHDIDVSHATEILYTLAAKPDLRKSLSEKGLQVSKKYSEETVKNAWLRLLASQENKTPEILALYSHGIGHREKEISDIKLKAKIIANESKINEEILDIGCGEGILCEELNRMGVKCSGVDTNSHKIDLASPYATNFVSFSPQLTPDLTNYKAIHLNRPDHLSPLELAGLISEIPENIERIYLSVDTTPISQDKNRKLIMSRTWWLARFAKVGFVQSNTGGTLITATLPDFIVLARSPFVTKKLPVEDILNDHRRIVTKPEPEEVQNSNGTDVSVIEASEKAVRVSPRTKKDVDGYRV